MSKTQTINNARGHPQEFKAIITEKSRHFIGRKFLFNALNQFLQQCDRGYFSIVGSPGSGKSAILAQYVTENPSVIYYNTQIEGKNLAANFLTTICTQLIEAYPLSYSSLPDNATEGSWFFSLLLQKISAQLEPQQQLIIAIDGLDQIDLNEQLSSSNLFYLPRYLPEKVYFILTRRPFLREKSGLLIEAPSQQFNLTEYPAENQADIIAYIQQFVKRDNVKNYLKSLPNSQVMSEAELNEQLTAKSENNFMYISHILEAIAQGFYAQGLDFNQLPPSLESYYQQHWEKMIPPNPPSKGGDHLRGLTPSKGRDRLGGLTVLNILVQQEEGITVEAIAALTDEDEYEIETVLEKWLEFLETENIEQEKHYRLYHNSFRNWLRNVMLKQ